MCPTCHKTLSSALSLRRHKEKYCRYREGKKARPPVVARQSVKEIDDDDGEIWSKTNARYESYVVRTKVSLDGRVRDYEMRPEEEVLNVESYLTDAEALVKTVFDKLSEYLVKGRLVMKAWFVKRDPATLEVLRRDMFYLASLRADLIHDFQHWYQRHISGIINNFNNLSKRDSDLEFDGIESLIMKFNLGRNLSGRAFFQLPDKLKGMQAVVNVHSKADCFEYALLSILHYNDLDKEKRRHPKHYRQWLGELDFGEVDTSDVCIKDVPKIEKLNNLKINVHVWEKGQLQGCVHNNINVLSDKTVNLLLIISNQGERHYCGIASLSRLYFHMKRTHCMQHICERCIRSFTTKEGLEEHYQWCIRGRLQIEQTPKQTKYSYKSLHHELSPLKVIYADIESFIHESIHYPAAIASYEVWHSHFTTRQENTTLQTWSGEECIVNFLRYLDETVQQQTGTRQRNDTPRHGYYRTRTERF